MLRATNEHSAIELAYDANGQLIKEKQISNLTLAGQTKNYILELKYQYDELGNRIATILPDGKVINQLYYGSGHLYNQSLYEPNTDRHIELRHSERNKRHQEITRQQGSIASVYDHDPMGRLTKQTSSSQDHLVIQRQYNYDPIGQLTDINGHTALTDFENQLTQQHTRNHHYQYDAVGRLTQHSMINGQNNTNMTEHFAFDPASNRIPVKTADTDQVMGRPTELTSQNKRIRYTYDNDGRVVNKTIEPNQLQSTNQLVQFKQDLQFQYNANNELERSICTQRNGTDTSIIITQYYYDAFGRRIHKYSEITQGSSTRHQNVHMLWDGDKAIQDYSDTHVYTTIYDQGSFTPIDRAVWLAEHSLQAVNDETNNGRESNLIQVYHYHNDQLGTPNELTNPEGEVVWLGDYEAW